MAVDLSQYANQAVQGQQALGAASNLGPGGTAPMLGSGAQGSDLLKLIIEKITHPQQQLAQPVPAPIPEQQPPHVLQGKGTGLANIVGGATRIISNAVAQHKQQQLAKAEADWTQLTTAIQSGNQNALNAIMQDPKKLKNMAKALNQDWLNPEKTDVYREALKNVMAQHGRKIEAMQGMKGLVSDLLGKNRQLQQQVYAQMNPQAMQKEMLAKAPMGQVPQGKEETQMILELMKEQQKDKDLSAQQSRLEEKEQFDAWKLGQAQKFEKAERQNQQAFSENMKRMELLSAEKRQSDRDITTLQALGMRLSEEDKKKIGAMKQSDINKEVGDTLTSMRKQETEAATQLNAMKSSAQKSRWYHPWGEAGPTEVDEAQKNYDNRVRAVDYITRNRGKINSGTLDLDTVVSQAQAIAEGRGDLSDLGGVKAQ